MINKFFYGQPTKHLFSNKLVSSSWPRLASSH